MKKNKEKNYHVTTFVQNRAEGESVFININYLDIM